MVLFLVAILSILIIAVLSISSNELKSARKYADGIEVRRMNDVALNIAIAQMRVGTRQVDSLSGKEIWVSQPGGTRIYDEKGEFVLGAKLYSDSKMVTDNETEFSNDLPPQDWNSGSNLFRYIDLNEPVTRRDQIYFPIADPSAFQFGVEGFDFNETAVDGARKTGDSLDLRLPMPVEWLYVLQKGEVGTLDDEGNFQGDVIPTAENPIVGRVAFWADDESAKINVNTASEPTFWDTPRAINLEDMNYGKFQPGRNEYQRYPGHPATTALSPVLFPNEGSTLTAAEKETIYDLIPRIGTGGTVGGTRRPGAVITTDQDRLFATIDEFIFQPDRDMADPITPDTLRMSGFFLTANSRAPELNPLGKPKIAMWPLGWQDRYPRTSFDNLIAFCSTTGGNLYAFQRYDSVSPRFDLESIPRNRELMASLTRDLGETIPGAGGHFAGKLGDDLDQIVVQVYDYIRSTNLRDLAPTVNADGTSGGQRFFASRGQVTPIQTGEGNMGFGRFFTFSEFGLHMICAGKGDSKPASETRVLEDDERFIEIGFLMEPFSSSMGWPPLYNDFTIKVSGLDGLEVKQMVSEDDGSRNERTESIDFPADRTYRPGGLSSSFHGRAWGGSSGIRTFIASSYPFISKRFIVRGDSVELTGGNVTVEIYQGNQVNADKLVQTINLDIPDADFPAPDLVETGTTAYRGSRATNPDFWWGLRSRYSRARASPHAPGNEYDSPTRRWPPDNRGNQPGFKEGGVFRLEDVVRSFVPAHGDYRLVAAKSVVPDSVFLPLPNYGDDSVNFDHLFADTQGTHLLYGFSNEPGLSSASTAGTQLTEAEYHFSRMPDVPPGAGALNLYGDFDNGVAQIGDGAYINRPDEGNVASKGQYAYFAWNYRSPTLVNFSPNRMIASPGMFGSLPTGVMRDRPWETLLFRPHEEHPGKVSPHDHLLMEYFWMPVVEPYAISVPFATAGKINMNYEMLPFSYIKRATGLHGVLKSEEPLAIPNEMSKIYKLWDHETSDHPWLPNSSRGNLDPETIKDWDDASKGKVVMRKPVDPEETLRQFEERFAENTLFKYPSEICELHLVREDETLEEYRTGDFWPKHLVTGDNVKERPYANIYPRLTTRSNVFRVHTRVEVIRKARQSEPEKFDPELDSIVGRYRGSSLVERYIDPTDEDQPDFADPSSADEDLSDSYQYRVLETRRFSP